MQDMKYILRVRILHNRMGLVSAKPSRMIFLLTGAAANWNQAAYRSIW